MSGSGADGGAGDRPSGDAPAQPGAPPKTMGAEPVEAGAEAGGDRLAHLAANRRLIIRRSLLATAVGGFIPLPVMDDYVAGRIRARLLVKLAEGRHVDLPLSSAELLADPREATAVRNATLTAATLVALKLAWKKFFALLAAGRRAEDMATGFQTATLFEHYCARLHMGGAIDRAHAARLRQVIHGAVEVAHRDALSGVFREGARVMGRSLLEAPGWVTRRIELLAERFVRSGGDPAAAAATPSMDDPLETGEGARWLDRATETIEARLTSLGRGYLEGLVSAFETSWRALVEAEARLKEAAAAAASASAPAATAAAPGTTDPRA